MRTDKADATARSAACRLRIHAAWSVAVCLAAAASAVLGQQAGTEAASAPVPAPGTLERLAARSGVQTCLGAVRRFGPALTGAADSHAALAMAHPVAPDASAFGVAIERFDAGRLRFVSAAFAPTLRGGCDMSYDMVDVWRKSCQDVALEDLRYTQPLKVIGQHVAVIPFGPTHHIYLIRIAGGCVSVGKEMLYP